MVEPEVENVLIVQSTVDLWPLFDDIFRSEALFARKRRNPPKPGTEVVKPEIENIFILLGNFNL